MSYLKKLIGISVTEVRFVHDYVQIVFDDEATLTINNNYDMEGFRLECLIGLKLSSFKECSAMVVLEFSEGVKLVVGMEDKDYSSPEAMILNIRDDIIVWN